MKNSPLKAIPWILPILLLWLGCGQAIGQTGRERTGIDERFFQAIQDSAIKFEILKPRLFFLQKTNGQLVKEKLASQNEQRFMSFQHTAQIQKFELQLADQPKKSKKWFFVGFVGGLIIGAIIH